MNLVRPIVAMSCGLAAAAAFAAGTHQHGVASLDVAVETGVATVAFASPLDNLAGFERAPRTDAERKRVETMLAALRNGDALFRFDPAAQCKLVGVEFESSTLKLGAAASAPAARGEHADLDAEYRFACAGASPAFVDVGLFAAFPRLARLDLQTAGAKGQSAATLKRGGATRVPLRP